MSWLFSRLIIIAAEIWIAMMSLLTRAPLTSQTFSLELTSLPPASLHPLLRLLLLIHV